MTQIKQTIERVLVASGAQTPQSVINGEYPRERGKELHQASIQPEELGKAFKCFHSAVQDGSIPAVVDLGNCYFYGHGIAQNAKRGVELYRLAANAGYPSGQLRLRECKYAGTGTEEDKLQRVQLYARAAEQGNIPAMYRPGSLFFLEG